MAAKGVYVSLRMGLDRATLPDNRTMVPGETYLISVDDFQRLSRSVRESVVTVSGIETSSAVVNGGFDGGTYTDLAAASDDTVENYAELGFKAGKVLQGLNGEAFKLCLLDGNAAAGDVLVWLDETAAVATKGTGTFAGVLTGSTDDGNLGWVQTEGIVSEANAETGVGAGDTLKAKSNGKFDTADEDGDTVATALSGESGGKIEVALRSTRARNRYVKRPNLFYPGQ